MLFLMLKEILSGTAKYLIRYILLQGSSSHLNNYISDRWHEEFLKVKIFDRNEVDKTEHSLSKITINPFKKDKFTIYFKTTPQLGDIT
jgi:hypothetical protein